MSVLSDQWIEQSVAKTHIPTYTNHQELTAKDETYFINHEAGYLMPEYNHDGKLIQELIWLDDRPPTLQAGDKHYFSYADHLNSPKAIIHISGKVLWLWDRGFLGVEDININHVHKDTNAQGSEKSGYVFTLFVNLRVEFDACSVGSCFQLGVLT